MLNTYIVAGFMSCPANRELKSKGFTYGEQGDYMTCSRGSRTKCVFKIFWMAVPLGFAN